MADEELQELTEDTAPASGDLVYVVVDPSGTPASRKMTVNNLLKAATLLTANTTPATTDELLLMDDPSGTLAAQKITLVNLLKVINSLTADATPGMDSVIAAIDDPSGTPVAKKTTLGQAYTRYVCIEIVDKDTALTIGNGKKAIHIPAELNGYNLVSVHAFNLTASSSGNPNFQVYNLTDTTDMLSTALTIDATETGSNTAATPAVIDTAKDDVATNDIIQIDCDTAGTGTKGVYVTLGFRAP